MVVSTPTVSPLRQRMFEDKRMRKFELKTQAGYLRAVRQWPTRALARVFGFGTAGRL